MGSYFPSVVGNAPRLPLKTGNSNCRRPGILIVADQSGCFPSTGIPRPVTPHVVHHTYAVNCLKRGIGLRALQYLLGHDRITTTEIYMHLSPEDAISEFQSKW